jgi:two-component system phosphate regulon sensor histidine kinase PhoR
MLWPTLTILAVATAVVVHWRWRNRFRQAQQSARNAIEALEKAGAQSRLELATQQQTLFNSMAAGVLLLDENGRIKLANRAVHTLFALTNELPGRTIIEGLRRHELAELVDSVRADKHPLSRELKLSGPPERWLEVNAAAIVDAAGRHQGTILVFHDLTRLKQFERARQEFVANVSHELRTPLSLIKGYVETLIDGAKDQPEVAAKFLQTIARNAERLQLIMEDLLTLSELESGQIRLNLQSVSLRSLGDKVTADLRTRAASRQVTLKETMPDLSAHADPDRIEQVLSNLVDNAIKYGRVGGTVTITARSADTDVIEVAVADNGPGIPPEALDRVFERFYRVDKGRSREQGGTGLGLSIVKHIVQNHGGRVWAASELGHGATFYFTLPRALPAPNA